MGKKLSIKSSFSFQFTDFFIRPRIIIAVILREGNEK